MKMQSVVAYVRNLLGWSDDNPAIRSSFKRDRADDDFESDDDSPALKRLKQLRRTSFPDVMASNDIWEKKERQSKNVRYVPIQVEDGHPSTSTPNDARKVFGRERIVPMKLVGVAENGPSTPARKPRMHTPVRPVIHAVVDDDDEPEIVCGDLLSLSQPSVSNIVARVSFLLAQKHMDFIKYPQNMTPHRLEFTRLGQYNNYPGLQNIDGAIDCTHVKIVNTPGVQHHEAFRNRKSYFSINVQVTWVQNKSQRNKPSKVYINLDDDDNEEDEDNDDVIFVKKVTTPPPEKPYKFFMTNSNDTNDSSEVYYRLSKKPSDRNSILSPKTYSKFKAPPGISKTYKKAPTPVARWMQPQKPINLSQMRNRYLNLNGNGRSAVSEVFNLDEKRNYQELIRRVAGSVKPINITKPLDIINLAEDSASFRMTQRAQKNSLNDVKSIEKDLFTEKENEASKEYDPATVASIGSSDSEVEIVPSESSSSSVRIEPINTFKDSLKDCPVTAKDWLAKLDTKYKKKNKVVQEKLKEAQRESDIISKVNIEQKLAHLEHKLKHELSIPESLIEEPQPTVELPKLTPEQEQLVSRALGTGPPGQLLVEKFNLRIHRRDLQTLAGLNWLNDEVINFYMNLLMQRSQERQDLPKVYAANTFFYPKLMQSGQAGLRRWTRKVDIFAHDLMVVPVHLGVHWCMSLVDFKTKRVSYLDSMGSSNPRCLQALQQYLRDEHQDKKGAPFDDKGWKAESLKDIPQQMNGSDCGMFACTFAEFASRRAPFSFSQAHMPYLRRKAALEILTGRLLL